MRRTGIRERRWLAADEPLAPLAARACAAGAGRRRPHAPTRSTRSSSRRSRPTASRPASRPRSRARSAPTAPRAVDLNAACAGFLYALDQAAALVETGRARVVLVCGAEALSRITDHDDRGTAVLFGDGAGAVVVAGGELDRGVARFVLGADAEQGDLLYAERDERKLRMEGREVYRHAVARMVEATREALERAGLTVDDIDLFVAHQANVAHHRGRRQRARAAAREGRGQRRPRRQHVVGVDPARAGPGRARRAA